MPLTGFHPTEGMTLSDPARNAATVTKSDSVDLTTTTRALYTGQAGDVKVTMEGGQSVTFVNLPAGFHPLKVTRVWATGTSSSVTDIMALW